MLMLTVMSLSLLLTACSQGNTNSSVHVPSQETDEVIENDTAQQTEEEPETNTSEASSAESSNAPAVYMTAEINAESLIEIYEMLEPSPSRNIAVKLSTGEPGSNYLRTDIIGELVQSFDKPTIVECNTAYGGSRANTAMHYQVAEDHGYTAIADVDIMDENGSLTLPVEGGDNLTENYVGANFANYDYYIVLSHFKGHSMAARWSRICMTLVFLLRLIRWRWIRRVLTWSMRQKTALL